MSRAERQQRWRQRSGRRRVEAYLPADTAARLDALAEQRGQSRAAVLADLIDAVGAESGAQVAQSARDTDTVDWVGETDTQAAQAPQTPPAAGEAERPRPQPRYQATTRQILAGRGHRTVDAYRVTARRTEIGTVWIDPASGGWRAVAADDDGYVLARGGSRREVTRRLVDYAMRQGWV